MKSLLWLPLLLFAGSLAGANRAALSKDHILRAMRDEMERSFKLRIANLDPPYYFEYGLADATMFSASATLGGLIREDSVHVRVPRIKVRVGSYDFDDTNFLFTDAFGADRYSGGSWPLDDNYDAMRQSLWLATDRAFKGAAQAMARKRATLQNMTPPEMLKDFARAEPVELVERIAARAIDENVWAGTVRRLSATFVNYPEITSSAVECHTTISTSYFLNSEGSVLRLPDDLWYLQVGASAIASDGAQVRDALTIVRLRTDQTPSEADLRRSVIEVADHVKALSRAPVGDDYSGPVLFDGIASAQLFGQVLGANLALTRLPLADPGRSLPLLLSELDGRAGSRILPESFDVVDDPSQTDWQGRPLAGHYQIDMEAVAAKPLTLVEKGILKNFLLTRQPVRGYEGSNGHARLGGSFGAETARISNLFIRSSQTVPEEELKKKLIEMCRQRGKPYGLIVRKLDYPSGASLEELRKMVTTTIQSGGSSRPVSAPILVYRVFPDGREELVRGVRFQALPVRALKDIVAASDWLAAFDYLDNGAPLALFGAASEVVGCSVIAPSVLIDDIDVERVREEVLAPPVVPPPPLQAVR